MRGRLRAWAPRSQRPSGYRRGGGWKPPENWKSPMSCTETALGSVAHGDLEPDARQPWQMTQAEFLELDRRREEARGTIGALGREGLRIWQVDEDHLIWVGEHELAVRLAIAGGKPVPPEILTELPAKTYIATPGADPLGGCSLIVLTRENATYRRIYLPTADGAHLPEVQPVSGVKDLALVILADFFGEFERGLEAPGGLLFLRRGYDIFGNRLKSYACHERFAAMFLGSTQAQITTCQIEAWLASQPPLDEWGYLPEVAPPPALLPVAASQLSFDF